MKGIEISFVEVWRDEENPCRSSHQRSSLKKAVLKNFAVFTWKYLYEIEGLTACNFIEKRLQHTCFSVNIVATSVPVKTMKLGIIVTLTVERIGRFKRKVLEGSENLEGSVSNAPLKRFKTM